MKRDKLIKYQRKCIGELAWAHQQIDRGLKPEGFQMPYLKRMRKALEMKED